MNEIFAGKHSSAEVEGWFTSVVGNVTHNAAIVEQAKANATPAQFANGDYRKALTHAVIKALESHASMSDQTLQDEKVFEQVAEVLLPEVFQRARQTLAQSSAL